MAEAQSRAMPVQIPAPTQRTQLKRRRRFFREGSRASNAAVGKTIFLYDLGGSLVLRTGFEPATFAVRGRCPKPLDDRSRPGQRIPASLRPFRQVHRLVKPSSRQVHLIPAVRTRCRDPRREDVPSRRPRWQQLDHLNISPPIRIRNRILPRHLDRRRVINPRLSSRKSRQNHIFRLPALQIVELRLALQSRQHHRWLGRQFKNIGCQHRPHGGQEDLLPQLRDKRLVERGLS